jgi:putative transposase
MPWKERNVVNLRTEFVLRVFEGRVPFGALCREYGISRKTGYKWKERFLRDGLEGLGDHSRRPRSSPSQVEEDTVCRAVRLKLAHPTWGPRKIRVVFGRTYAEESLPSESTFKRILDKAGLVKRRRRRSQPESGRLNNAVQAQQANQVWTVDFKGWWYTGDRSRFEPLTVRDAYSRYMLCARALDNARSETVRREFERLFARYGLPEVIRSDNGSPFASCRAPLGLSRLSAWWLALGIDLDRIEPGRPDQNGGHERMHRDIAWELEVNSAEDQRAQQAALDTWRETFNHERPHEALGMGVPANLYEPSPRRFEPGEVVLEYPREYLRRRVSANGTIQLRKRCVGVSEALTGWDVGLEPTGRENRWGLWFCRLRLGEIELETLKFHVTAGGGGARGGSPPTPPGFTALRSKAGGKKGKRTDRRASLQLRTP